MICFYYCCPQVESYQSPALSLCQQFCRHQFEMKSGDRRDDSFLDGGYLMAAIFCLFSVTLCKLAGQDLPSPTGIDLKTSRDAMALSSPQIITVPRVYISPCPHTFRYTFNGKKWFGLLAVPSVQQGRTLHIRVHFSLEMNFVAVSLNVYTT
jgi:hypothetical protein